MCCIFQKGFVSTGLVSVFELVMLNHVQGVCHDLSQLMCSFSTPSFSKSQFLSGGMLKPEAEEEKGQEAKSPSPLTVNPRSVEMLDGFVKRLTSVNEMLALSVAQLSVLVDFELQGLRQIYAELGMPQMPDNTSADEWLLAIHNGAFPSHLRGGTEAASNAVQGDNRADEVEVKVEEETQVRSAPEVR